jgi:hypothetical protein
LLLVASLSGSLYKVDEVVFIPALLRECRTYVDALVADDKSGSLYLY